MKRNHQLLIAIALLIANSSAAANQVLRGQVLDAVTSEAVPGATVETAVARTIAVEDGSFSLELPPGTWAVTVSATDYLDQTISIDIGERLLRELEVSLFPMSKFTETVEVRAVRPRRQEVSATQIEPQKVMQVAGSLDNIFRTVQALPSVAATEDFGSRLSVRGGEPDQNLTIMDGVEVSNP